MVAVGKGDAVADNLDGLIGGFQAGRAGVIPDGFLAGDGGDGLGLEHDRFPFLKFNYASTEEI
jgi:hypothetical protein